jgi:hypothetical protein
MRSSRFRQSCPTPDEEARLMVQDVIHQHSLLSGRDNHRLDGGGRALRSDKLVECFFGLG